MSAPARGDRGIALAATLFVLVVLAAIVAGLAFAALQEFRVGRNTVRDQRAFGAAEAGLDAVLGGWDARGFGRLEPGDTAPFAGSLSGGTGSYSGVVRRLSTVLFLIRSTGQDAAGTSRRSLAAVARLEPLSLSRRAALAVSGAVRIGPSAQVRGADASPDGWACPLARDTAPALLAGDLRALDLTGCPAGSCLAGNPPALEDSMLARSSVPVLGESGWAALAAVADTTRIAGPARLPLGAWPVVLSSGDLDLRGGEAWGILLVGGNLVIEGGAHFAGLVVVRETLTIRDSGTRIDGAVFAAKLAAGSEPANGPVLVGFSTCAVLRALAAAAPIRRLRERGWSQLY